MPPSAGERFECRVARVLAAEGAFVRRRVDLQRNWGERFTITDVDLYVLRFTDPLLERVAVGECKATDSKSAPGVPDRLLWVAGVQRLVAADAAFVAVHKSASPTVRRLSEEIGCSVIDANDLARREQLLGLGPQGPPYAHDPRLVELEQKAQREAKRDQDLDRVYWFLRSEFWFQRPIAGLKRALGALRLLGRQWAPDIPESRRQCVEWLTLHAVLACVVAMARIAGAAYRTPEDTFEERLSEQLSEGKADYEALVEISGLVDRYVTEVLSRAGLHPAQVVDALGAFAPTRPHYTEPLIEVLQRLAKEPLVSGRLPQYTDERVARALLSIPGQAVANDEEETLARLLRIVLTFLRGQARLPQGLSDRLVASPATAAQGQEQVPEPPLPVASDARDQEQVDEPPPPEAPEGSPRLFGGEGGDAAKPVSPEAPQR